VISASCKPVEQEDRDEVDGSMEEDIEDGVDDVVSELRRRPVSRSSSTTKRSRADLVTHQDFQPALVAADDGRSHIIHLCVFYGSYQFQKLTLFLKSIFTKFWQGKDFVIGHGTVDRFLEWTLKLRVLCPVLIFTRVSRAKPLKIVSFCTDHRVLLGKLM